MRKQKQPGHNIGRSRPSIAYELKYRKTLQSLVAEMRADIQKVLEEYQRKHVYDASSPLRMIFSKLRDKWYIRFEKSRSCACSVVC